MNAVSFRYQPDLSEPADHSRSVVLKTEQLRKVQKAASKVVLPTMEGLCFEKIKHILYLEANGNYTTLHLQDKRQILVCKTLREVELMLPVAAFVRIHRSHTIHLRFIKKYLRGKGGHVILQNGITLAVSAGQKECFMDALKRFFGN